MNHIKTEVDPPKTKQIQNKKCCGHVWSTNYCPTCGTELKLTHDIYSLLRYIETKVTRTTELRIRDQEVLDSNNFSINADAKSMANKIERDRKEIERWGAWATTLKELISVSEESRYEQNA